MKATTLHLALIGDYNPDVTAHQAIPVALQQATDALGLSVQWHWLDTDSITLATELHTFDGFWCVPASRAVVLCSAASAPSQTTSMSFRWP